MGLAACVSEGTRARERPSLVVRGPGLTLARILAWADEHRRRTGRWPNQRAGAVAGTDLTWGAIAQALRMGLHGLPGGDTLAALLARERGAEPASGRYHRRVLTVEDIVRWAEWHRMRTGRWPSAASGVVLDAPEETWGALNQALSWGRRGLPGGSSLSRRLAGRRTREGLRRPRLTVEQILAWAEAHRRRTGRWPTAVSGPVAEAPGESWNAINRALWGGNRGLPKMKSLRKLLRP
jgi:hypothetical protein